jgi:hypothetical protein
VWPNIKAIWDGNDLPAPLGCFSGFAADHTGDPAKAYVDAHWPPSAYGEVIGDHGFCNLSERPDIQRITIDALTQVVAAPTAVTIDAEGAELRVLSGAQETLAWHRPLVWVSVHPEFMADMYSDTPEKLDGYMRSLDYEKTPLCVDHEAHVFFWPAERKLFVQ